MFPTARGSRQFHQLLSQWWSSNYNFCLLSVATLIIACLDVIFENLGGESAIEDFENYKRVDFFGHYMNQWLIDGSLSSFREVNGRWMLQDSKGEGSTKRLAAHSKKCTVPAEGGSRENPRQAWVNENLLTSLFPRAGCKNVVVCPRNPKISKVAS